MKKLFLPKFMFITSLLILGCSDNEDFLIQFTKFPVEYDLHSKPIISLNTPGAFLELYDTLLFCCNSYDQKYFIRIYNKNSLELYTKLLRRGKGPGEMSLFGRIALDFKNRSLWISDYLHNDLWGYSIDSLLKRGNTAPLSIIHLPNKVYPIIEFHCYDSLFYLPDLGGGTGFMVFNNKGMEIKHIGNLDLDENKKIIGTEYNYTLSNIFPQRNEIVTAYRYFDKLIIRKLNGENYRIAYGPDHLDIDKQLKSDDFTRKEAYFPYYPKAFDNFIFAIYNGEPGMIINKDLGSSVATSGRKIHVFDWDGTPVARLKLDHQIISFVIDSLKNRIIAFALDADTSIVEYDIRNVLQGIVKNTQNETSL